MQVAGIICEYNPLHLGHMSQVLHTRDFLGDDTAIVCVMSGNFVQRGEPAIIRKHARAEAALKCGADLVLELPVAWSISSAERFSFGGVSILNALGVVTHLSFGSECGDVGLLKSAADILTSDKAQELIRGFLGTGLSYAAARQKAADTLMPGKSDVLKSPNNILGVEYLKALRNLSSDISPLTISRIGAGHDGGAVGYIASASYLRERLLAGDSISDYVPQEAELIYRREIGFGTMPVSIKGCESAILYRLRTMTDEQYASLPDSSEGLWMRLANSARREASIENILKETKTKRYALARIRRMITAAYLGITSDMALGTPPYIRVLGLNEKGREVLKMAKSTASLPIITKPAASRLLEDKAAKTFELEARATDIYSLFYPSASTRIGGTEWTTGPVIIQDR